MPTPKPSSYRERTEEEHEQEGSTPLIAYKVVLMLAIMGGGSLGALTTTLLGLCRNQRGWENDLKTMIIMPIGVAALWFLGFYLTRNHGRVFLGLGQVGWRYVFPGLCAAAAICGFLVAKNL